MITNDNDNDNGRQNSNDNDNDNDKVQCEFQKEIKLKDRKKNWNSLPHSLYVSPYRLAVLAIFSRQSLVSGVSLW